MTSFTDDESLELSPYRVRSRREIVSVLRGVGQRNQLVRLQTKNGGDSAVTSVLYVDDANDMVIIDAAPSALTNQRILESDEIAFETVLENIRILFFASSAESCEFEDRPALKIAIPEILVRLQRREFYRVAVPVSSQVQCTIPVPGENGEIEKSVVLPLFNVSAGGIALVGDKAQLDPAFNTVYENCRIDLPGGAVVVALQFRNSHEIALASRKEIRRLGFKFVDPSNAVSAAVQRYITKLEREQNARKTGMG
jgi:c-di-GMP-binding flagellar brake protein YcgR